MFFSRYDASNNQSEPGSSRLLVSTTVQSQKEKLSTLGSQSQSQAKQTSTPGPSHGYLNFPVSEISSASDIGESGRY